jgi:hypothetical protein
MWDIIEEAFRTSAEARDRDAGKSIAKELSLHHFIKEKSLELVPDDDERELLVQMSEGFGAYIGEPVWRQSLRFAWMEECCGGGKSDAAK